MLWIYPRVAFHSDMPEIPSLESRRHPDQMPKTACMHHVFFFCHYSELMTIPDCWSEPHHQAQLLLHHDILVQQSQLHLNLTEYHEKFNCFTCNSNSSIYLHSVVVLQPKRCRPSTLPLLIWLQTMLSFFSST